MPLMVVFLYSQHYLYELVIKTLVQHNLFYMLHQFLQYHVLSDSKPLVRKANCFNKLVTEGGIASEFQGYFYFCPRLVCYCPWKAFTLLHISFLWTC